MKVLLNPETEPGRPLQALFRQRLAPLQKHLGGVKHLIVLPSPVMASVPIEALTDQYRISYAPSATIFAWLREKAGKRPATTEVLALGDPAFAADQDKKAPAAKEDAVTRLLRIGRPKPLPGTRAEVLAIARLFAAHKTPVTKFLGNEANGQNLDQLAKKKDLTRFRYLHLATHGYADEHGGMNSYLALTPEDFAVSTHAKLSAGQIWRTWNLNADLVTLSACQTALGEHRGGEGYVGFAQALIFAGSRSLLLSQWPVHDYATTLLMYRFYENLLGSEKKQPMAKADALAEAKTWVKKLDAKEVVGQLKSLGVPVDAAWAKQQPERPFEHPYYWAAFILVGDPGLADDRKIGK
jgi:CHAT domain-containing protein